MSVSQVAFTNALPALSSARILGDWHLLRHKIRAATLLSLGTFALGALVIVAIGPALLAAIGSRTPILDLPQLLAMALIFMLELNHSNFAGVITTRNEVPFVKAALLSGLATILCSLFFLKTSDLGVWALLLSQGLVQLAYNNWKWPLEVWVELRERG